MTITLRAYSITEGGTYHIIDGTEAPDAGDLYVRLNVIDQAAVIVTEGEPDALTILDITGVEVVESGRVL